MNGSTFLNPNIFMDAANPLGRVTFTFDSPVTAFGADFTSLNNSVVQTYAVVGGVTFDPLPQSPSFLGFVSDTPFTTISFLNPLGGGNKDEFGLDNLAFSSANEVPAPAAAALLVTGLALTAPARRR